MKEKFKKNRSEPEIGEMRQSWHLLPNKYDILRKIIASNVHRDCLPTKYYGWMNCQFGKNKSNKANKSTWYVKIIHENSRAHLHYNFWPHPGCALRILLYYIWHMMSVDVYACAVLMGEWNAVTLLSLKCIRYTYDMFVLIVYLWNHIYYDLVCQTPTQIFFNGDGWMNGAVLVCISMIRFMPKSSHSKWEARRKRLKESHQQINMDMEKKINDMPLTLHSLKVASLNTKLSPERIQNVLCFFTFRYKNYSCHKFSRRSNEEKK